MGYNSNQVPAHFLHLLSIPLRNFFLRLIFLCEVLVRRHGQPDCIVLVQPFVSFHEVENPHIEVVKHADLHCMEKVGLREVAHDAGIMSKHIESAVNLAPREFGIGCLGVGIAERLI